ncbi:MAG: CHAT domain-containing protein [Polyangiales bacterium]
MKRLCWVALLVACKGKPAPAPAPVAQPNVEISGCASLATAPLRCELGADRTVRLVISSPGVAPSIAPAERSPVTRGERLRIVVPRETSELRVGSWSVTIVDPPKIQAIEDARALREARKLDEAEAKLASFLVDAKGEPRARALSMHARIALARGKLEDAVTRFREAIALHRSLHRRSDEVDDAFALAFLYSDRSQRFADARAVLAELDALDDYPDGAARKPYYAGTIALGAGDLRSAIHDLRDARARSERLTLAKLVSLSEQALALALSRSGKGNEALTLLQGSLARDKETLTACASADLSTNIGWVSLLMRDAETAAHDPVPPLEAALALYSGPCADPLDKANVLLNLALAAVLRGTFDAAAARLAEARVALQQESPGPQLALWMAELDGRIALGKGDTKTALTAFARQRLLASSTFAADAEWRAVVGTGEALEAKGDDTGALAAYREAESLLDRASVDVAVLDARDAFLGDREKSARLLVDLLVRKDRGPEALAAARTARSRSIAALFRQGRVASLAPDARARWESLLAKYRKERAELDREADGDWKLPNDRLAEVRAARKEREASLRSTVDDAFALVARGTVALPEIEEGDVLLLQFPARSGFVGFAADKSGVTVSRAEGLAPFRDKLATAKRIRVLPYGARHAIDVHALPFEGELLIDRAPVVYALDLAGAKHVPPEGALLVADPTGDLPAARAEADVVAKAFTTNLTSLRGTAATTEAVLHALPKASLFHYAGHAIYVGDDPWESVLPLSNGKISIVDVLALSSAPRIVSLFACESGRTVTRGEGLGLAQSFLAAGAEIVIASTRDVADGLAAELAREMYGNVGSPLLTDVPTSLRRAQIALRKREPAWDWAAFRAFVP